MHVITTDFAVLQVLNANEYASFVQLIPTVGQSVSWNLKLLHKLVISIHYQKKKKDLQTTANTSLELVRASDDEAKQRKQETLALLAKANEDAKIVHE